MSLPKISFIVPYSHRSWCPDDNRLITLLSSLQNIRESETVLHLSGVLPTNILKTLQAFPQLVTVKSDQPRIYSAGQARNDAVRHASGEYLFFVDADLSLHPQLAWDVLQRTRELANIGIQAFDMYPCIYLGEQVNWLASDEGSAFQSALQGLMQGRYSIANGVALASSCLLVNRNWFEELGGFDAEFVGHGGEDLELIHRLCLHYHAGNVPDDYLLNHKSSIVADYQGFRQYFSCYGLPHLFANRFLVHHWHSRPLSHSYHRARKSNDDLLITKLRQRCGSHVCISAAMSRPACWNTGFHQWLIDTQEQAGYPLECNPGLFRLNELEIIPRPIKNKLRKLVLTPGRFFKDALAKRLG